MTKDLLKNIKPAEPFEVDLTPFWCQYTRPIKKTVIFPK